ncbi:MAG: hypothetical protein H0U86_13335 [Chloroflexi bacterium]|nr:hypothetical protein [Chloroflexota bacterium]
MWPTRSRRRRSRHRRSNRSVADRLSISVKTVEAQVATIFSKLALEEHPDDNRRVLAVLAYLDGRA